MALGTSDLGILTSLYAQLFKQLVSDPRSANEELAEEALFLVGSKRKNVEPKFSRLVTEWKANRHSTSLARDLIAHPAYLRIIGMGEDALPLILRELERELDHWFSALKAISDDDPVPPASRGKMREMADAWLRWGREKGYVW
jgi:hypothetical protein